MTPVEQQIITSVPQISRPAPLQSTQTAQEGTPGIKLAPQSRELNHHDTNGTSPVELTSPNSNSARMQAEMRSAEGRAFKLASQSFDSANNSSSSGMNSDIKGLAPAPLPIHTRMPSPNQFPPQLAPGLRASQSSDGSRSVSNSKFQAAAIAVGTEAVGDYSNRVQHLFKLFELSAESVMPITASSFELWVRAASWWFLKGRASIENAIRARPSSPEGQRSYDILRQQGHADVAKSLWIIRNIIAQRAELKMH
jgi:hypothetical protein